MAGRPPLSDEKIRAFGDLVEKMRRGGVREAHRAAMIVLDYEWSSPSTPNAWMARYRKLPPQEASSSQSSSTERSTGSWLPHPDAIQQAGDFGDLVKILLAGNAQAKAAFFLSEPEGRTALPPKDNIIPRRWWAHVKAHDLGSVTFESFNSPDPDDILTVPGTLRAVDIKVFLFE